MSTAENMSLSISAGGTCVPLGNISVSFGGSGNGACSNGTGVGTVSFSTAGVSASAFAQWTATSAGIVLDSVVTNPSADNWRVKMVLASDPSDSISSTRANVCTKTTTTDTAPVAGSITFNGVTGETVPYGEGCDTERPSFGVNPNDILQDVDNPPDGRLVDCSVEPEPVNTAVGDVAATASSTAMPVARGVLGALRAAGIEGGPQCVEGEWFQPKGNHFRAFRGNVVATGEAGNHAAHLSYTETAQFTSGVSVSASFTTKMSAMFAGVEATFGVELKADWSTSNSRGFSIDIPPHSTGWIKYGHARLYTDGHYFRRHDDCTVDDLGSASIRGPYAAAFKGS